MSPDIDFPKFDETSDPQLVGDAILASMAALAEDIQMLLHMLREHALEVMLHSDDDGEWCLHLPQIFEKGHTLKHENLPHLLAAGMAFSLKYKQDKREAARLN